MLEVSNLSFVYYKEKHFYLPKVRVPIFDQINFSLSLGENLLVYGSSGSGKSTLGKVLAGLLKPYKGEIRLGGERIFGIAPHRIQYIFQDQKTALNPYKNVKRLIGDVVGKTLDISQILDQFALDERILGLRSRALSSGEAQRVGLLRALLLRPKVLICDEILESLDILTANQILEILKTYQRQNQMSYIFISHQKRLFEGMYQKTLYLS
ncbi:ATP-binding cassette domain-containing protein [Helicobacter kayseriensis]|uniref:ATP-binding cassette domain-containing protein n=1 Tax=Helicobacter kayseriensis TaxID=2905877 RepID=UPI001E5AB12D|nr:ATP-binding cassette domain-containing protein [Helicobacter kayseriensis]MCE3047730.1 ATP-binding cassette domain-containing protein [Helicobacter kayseriensis]MCE3049119.1 ATP-binding cassette domain-containing protein [Helicobacter kayseriensis]